MLKIRATNSNKKIAKSAEDILKQAFSVNLILQAGSNYNELLYAEACKTPLHIWDALSVKERARYIAFVIDKGQSDQYNRILSAMGAPLFPKIKIEDL